MTSEFCFSSFLVNEVVSRVVRRNRGSIVSQMRTEGLYDGWLWCGRGSWLELTARGWGLASAEPGGSVTRCSPGQEVVADLACDYALPNHVVDRSLESEHAKSTTCLHH